MSPLAAEEDAAAGSSRAAKPASTVTARPAAPARRDDALSRTGAPGASGAKATTTVVPQAPASSSATAASQGSGWQPRKGLALALQVAIVVTPGLVALAVSLLLGNVLPRPNTLVLAVARLFAILAVSAATMVATRLVVRRLAPLAFLLRLSLAFPNETPKRLRTALRAPSARDLEQRLSDIDERGIAAEPKDVAAEIVSMVAALSSHHRLTRGHSERVRAYAELIGIEIGLDEQELQKLRWAALLHDLGKVTVPTEILDLKGRPDPEEWAILSGHPAASARLAESLKDWLGPWWYGIGQHHEKWDGSGYPDKLAGQDIALAGRIVALADAFETMTAVRSYKRAMSMPAAQEEVVRSAGTHFDPDVVRAFLNIGLRRLRRVAGYAALLPLQAVGVLRQLTNLATPVLQSPAALAIATTVAATTFVPALNASAVVAPRSGPQVMTADDLRRPTEPSTVFQVGGSEQEAPQSDAGSPSTAASSTTSVKPARTTVPARTTAPARPAAASPVVPTPVTGSTTSTTPKPGAATTAPDGTTPPPAGTEPDPTTVPATEPDPATTAAPDTVPPATAPPTTAPPVTAAPTTAPPVTAAPTTAAPATTTATTAAPTTTASPTTTVAALPLPTFAGATVVTVNGDGRRLSVKPNVNGHGQSTTCTVSILTTAVTSTAGCSSTQQLDAPQWNTTYTVRTVATSAGGSVQTDVVVTTDPKAMVIDASSHWPCPGWFCGSAASGFASPSIFASFTTHAQGTPVSLVCRTVGGTVDTRSPISSGTEVTNIWVKSNEATNPYYSVLSFPTPGPSAADGLPTC